VVTLAKPIEDVRAAVAKAPTRRAVVEALVAAGAAGAGGAEGEAIGVAMAALKDIKGASTAVRELEKAGLVIVSERERALDAVAIGDSDGMAMLAGPPPVLTAEQVVAVDTITHAMREPGPFTPFLLHGVTGSGKTEVYLRVIADTLEAGKTALVLVPEISLTPQLAARFRARFGDQVAILHSGLGDQARLGECRGCVAGRRASRWARGRRCSRRCRTWA